MYTKQILYGWRYRTTHAHKKIIRTMLLSLTKLYHGTYRTTEWNDSYRKTQMGVVEYEIYPRNLQGTDGWSYQIS